MTTLLKQEKTRKTLLGPKKTLIPKGAACCCHRRPKSCSFKLYNACTYGQKLYFFFFNLLFQFLFSGKYCGDKFPPIITSSGFEFCVSNFLSILSWEKRMHKWEQLKAEQFAKLQFLYNKNYQNTNTQSVFAIFYAKFSLFGGSSLNQWISTKIIT